MKFTRFPLLAPALALLLALPAAAGEQVPKQSPCSASDYRQFDFWIGNWTVTNPEGKVVGHNRVERIENGCGIRENWRGSGGSSGRSINAYSHQDGRWHQTWLGSGGLLLQLTGGRVNGSMVLSGTTRHADGSTVRERITWTPLEDGRVRQHWQQSSDGGKTWKTAFDGMYSKQPAHDAGPSGHAG